MDLAAREVAPGSLSFGGRRPGAAHALICVLLVGMAGSSARVAMAAVQDTVPARPDSVYRLEGLVVTVTRGEQPVNRIPRAVSWLERQTVQRAQQTLSLEESLRFIPGIIVESRQNFALGDRISIRGVGSRAQFGVRGIKIVADGIPLTLPDGQAQLTNLDLGSAGRVEVIRGPSSSLYGNAGGGVILVETERPESVPLRLEPRGLVGAFDLRKWQGKASGALGPADYVLDASRTTVKGFRAHAAAHMTAVNALARWGVSPRTGLGFSFNFYDSPFAKNPSSLDRATADSAPESARLFVKRQGAGERAQQGQGGVHLRHALDAERVLEASAYGLWRELLNPIPGRIIDLSRQAGGVRSVLRGRASLFGQRFGWILGTDVELQRDDRVEFENRGIDPAQVPDSALDDLEPAAVPGLVQKGALQLDQEERVRGVGPFAELDLEPGSRWNLTLGARYDRYRFEVRDRRTQGDTDDSGARAMHQLSPLIGVGFRAHPSVNLYGNFATAFQTPTTSELSNRPEGVGGFNPELEPERIRSLEAGVKGTIPSARFAYSLAAYRARVRDALLPFQVPGSEEVFFRNAGQTRHVGVELAAQWQAWSGLRTHLAYSWSDFEFTEYVDSAGFDFSGRQVPGVPAHRIFLALAYEHPLGLFGELHLRWVDEFFANDFNGPPPGSTRPADDFVNPAYAVLDLRLGFDRAFDGFGLAPFLGVNNVLDERYNGSIVPNALGARFFEPAPGRNLYFGVSLSFRPASATRFH